MDHGTEYLCQWRHHRWLSLSLGWLDGYALLKQNPTSKLTCSSINDAGVEQRVLVSGLLKIPPLQVIGLNQSMQPFWRVQWLLSMS